MSNKINHSMSLAKPDAFGVSTKQKIAVVIGILGLFILVLAGLNTNFPNKGLFLILALGFIIAGTIIFSNSAYLTKLEGIKNDGVWYKSISSRGLLGWISGIVFTLFYIVLYFFPNYLGLGINGEVNTGLISLFEPLSNL